MLPFKHNRSNQKNIDPFDGIVPGAAAGAVRITFTAYSKHFILLGLFMLIAATVFLVQHDTELLWSDVLLVTFLYLFGLICLILVRVERVSLDKELCSITLSNRKLYAMLLNCRGDVLIQELENIINVSIEDFGEMNGDLDTRSHKLNFKFKDGSACSVLESRSIKKMERHLRKIQTFLEKTGQNSPPKRSSPTKFNMKKEGTQPKTSAYASTTI